MANEKPLIQYSLDLAGLEAAITELRNVVQGVRYSIPEATRDDVTTVIIARVPSKTRRLLIDLLTADQTDF